MFPDFLKYFKPKAAKNAGITPVQARLERARLLNQRGQFAEASESCQQILEQQPEHVESLILWAELEARQGNRQHAIDLYTRAINLKPNHVLAYYKRANLLKDSNQLEAALASYDQALALDPACANAFCNRGVVLWLLNRSDEALANYDQAIALNPGDSLAHYNRGNLLKDRKQMEAALASYDQAVALNPVYADAFCNRGVVLGILHRPNEALESYDRAIALNPSALAYFNRGDALSELKRLDEALDSYNEAISLRPDYAEAHCNRGGVLFELKDWSGALASFRRCIEIDSGIFHAHHNMGHLLNHLKQHAAAVASYDKAYSLDPDFRCLLGTRRLAKMTICDWGELASDVDRLTAAILADATASPPFVVLALLDSAELQHKAARIWVRSEHPAEHTLPTIPRHTTREKIRLGYFSADFWNHPVAVLSAEFLESHDRSKFEVTAFSFGPDTQDHVRKRLELAFDRFIDVRGMSDQEVALLARSMGIDIAVDLGGHTGNSRTRIFALRAAPIQINYLGYPGTMGAEYIDYLIGDRIVVPEAQQRHFTEKIVYLPNSYLPHDSSRKIADNAFTREDLGLPTAGFLFCCFNNNYKITPDTFDSWMRILDRVEDSVLWLARNNPTAESNLRREALHRGVDPGRLVFADRMTSSPEHLARQRVADLFLDTRPYNAHATALDALWAGLPVLTCVGEGFASRVAASVLSAIQLPELITATPSEYEDLAVQLAKDPRRLAEIRQKLARNRFQTSLFDTRAFTRRLEAAYSKIHERHLANLPPEHVYVES
jgi:predicted O-linked N-acetylglucosamine transferase (SPINDLY family)